VSLKFLILYLWFSGMFRRSNMASKCLSMSLGSSAGVVGSGTVDVDFDRLWLNVVKTLKTLPRPVLLRASVESFDPLRESLEVRGLVGDGGGSIPPSMGWYDFGRSLTATRLLL
jgi:hypothetical protein